MTKGLIVSTVCSSLTTFLLPVAPRASQAFQIEIWVNLSLLVFKPKNYLSYLSVSFLPCNHKIMGLPSSVSFLSDSQKLKVISLEWVLSFKVMIWEPLKWLSLEPVGNVCGITEAGLELPKKVILVIFMAASRIFVLFWCACMWFPRSIIQRHCYPIYQT